MLNIFFIFLIAKHVKYLLYFKLQNKKFNFNSSFIMEYDFGNCDMQLTLTNISSQDHFQEYQNKLFMLVGAWWHKKIKMTNNSFQIPCALWFINLVLLK